MHPKNELSIASRYLINVVVVDESTDQPWTGYAQLLMCILEAAGDLQTSLSEYLLLALSLS